MLALLIKPAAMRRKSNRAFVAHLVADGAFLISGHDPASIRKQLIQILESNPDLTAVACGGDGTVNLLLNSIIGLPIKFAVAPMGTGNDFARHVGIKNLKIAEEILRNQFFINMDVGQISFPNATVKHFAAVASCGFDAQVNERANKLSGPDGPIKYIASVFGELKNLASVALNLRYNDDSLDGRFTLVAVGNTSSYGGGMKITPAADLQDGLFSLTIVDQANRRTLVKVLPTVFTGRHVFHPKVSVDQTEQIEISGSHFSIYADGEKMGYGPATFKVLPGCVQLLAPLSK